MLSRIDNESRHAKMADDSRRVCIVVPKHSYDFVASMLYARRRTVSDVLRGFIADGILREKARMSRAEKKRENEGNKK